MLRPVLGPEADQFFPDRHLQEGRVIGPLETFLPADRLSGTVDPSEVVRPVKGGVEIDIMVTPNAKKDQVGEVDEWRKRLIIKVRAVPSEGRANRAVVELLSELLGARAEIIHGHTDRHKTVLVPVDLATARSRLEGR